VSPPFTSTGRFEISRVLSRTFGVLGRNFGPFILTAAVLVGLPMVALGFVQLPQVADAPRAGQPITTFVDAAFFLWIVAYVVTAALLQAVLIHGAVADLNGRKASLLDGLSTAMSKALPLIGLSLVVGLLTGLGTLLLIVPGILIALAFCVAVPSLVVERRGVFDAMQRSRDLTRNHRGAIFGLFILYAVATLIIQMMGSAIAGLAAVGGIKSFLAVNSLVVTPIVQVLNALLLAAGTASIYYELRFIKEGVGPEALASVFD
jgi:hypothetical protein